VQRSLNEFFDFGKYRLDQKIDDFAGLEEFSPLEYEAIKRTFKGERNYNAPPVNFLGRSWQLMLSNVHRQIHKIAILISLPTKQEGNSIEMEALQYCKERLGPPSEQRTSFFFWDRNDANVVLQTTTKGADGFLVAMFLTSVSVRQLELL
jgi:hypothetical protein